MRSNTVDIMAYRTPNSGSAISDREAERIIGELEGESWYSLEQSRRPEFFKKMERLKDYVASGEASETVEEKVEQLKEYNSLDSGFF